MRFKLLSVIFVIMLINALVATTFETPISNLIEPQYWPVIILSTLIFTAVAYFAIGKSTAKSQVKAKKYVEGERRKIRHDNLSVEVEYRDGVWHSPFHSRGNYFKRKDWMDIKSSVKGCLRKQEFKKQKLELIKNGIIKKERSADREN